MRAKHTKEREQSFHTVMHECTGNGIRTINHLFQYKWNTTSKRQQTSRGASTTLWCDLHVYKGVLHARPAVLLIYTNSPAPSMVSVCSCRWRKQGSSKRWTSTTTPPLGKYTSRCCSELCCSKQNPKAIES